MQFEQPARMNWATGILFLFPCSLMVLAWMRLARTEARLIVASWRKYFVQAALGVGGLATLLNMVRNVSWLRNGGSLHGMSAGDGIWQPLGPFSVWTLVIATVLGVAFARGWSRLFFAGWSVSMCFVFQMIYLLQLD